jgi:hypothetical protein
MEFGIWRSDLVLKIKSYNLKPAFFKKQHFKDRQWTYQVCSELGLWVTTDSSHQPFGDALPLEFLIKQCTDVFGKEFNQSSIQKRLKHMKIDYGGLNYEGSRVVFINGDMDPWYIKPSI